jgi:predicted MFS family arabinose efflux permease
MVPIGSMPCYVEMVPIGSILGGHVLTIYDAAPAPAGHTSTTHTPASSPGVLGQAVRLALGTASALGLARFGYGLLLPAMRDDLGWSFSGAGALSTANGLGYLAGALLTPFAVRRWGTGVTFRVGMLLIPITLAVSALGANYVTMLGARAAAGVAGAAVFIAGGVIASHLGSATVTARPVAVYFAGTGVGIVASAIAVTALGDRWQIGWIALGVAAVAATTLSWGPSHASESSPAPGGRAQIRPLTTTAVAYLLFATGYITYITFLSEYLRDRDAGEIQIALTWIVLGCATIASPWLWGRPITTWPEGRALAVLLGALSLSAALAWAVPAPAAIITSAVVYGATFMCVPSAVSVLIKTHASPVDWTPTLAAFTTLFAVGQTAGPWLAGLIADRTSSDAAIAWTTSLCAMACTFTVLATRRARDAKPSRATATSKANDRTKERNHE